MGADESRPDFLKRVNDSIAYVQDNIAAKEIELEKLKKVKVYIEKNPDLADALTVMRNHL